MNSLEISVREDTLLEIYHLWCHIWHQYLCQVSDNTLSQAFVPFLREHRVSRPPRKHAEGPTNQYEKEPSAQRAGSKRTGPGDPTGAYF